MRHTGQVRRLVTRARAHADGNRHRLGMGHLGAKDAELVVQNGPLEHSYLNAGTAPGAETPLKRLNRGAANHSPVSD